MGEEFVGGYVGELEREVERLRAEVALWRGRTEQGAEIIEGNVVRITELEAQLRSAQGVNTAARFEADVVPFIR